MAGIHTGGTVAPTQSRATHNGLGPWSVAASGGHCVDPQNWMGCMFPSGNRGIGTINMPGSHDSATFTINAQSTFVPSCAAFGEFVNTIDFVNAVSSWAKTQSADLGAQAANGARYFDVRPAWVDGEWKTCHSLAGASMDQAVGPHSGLQRWALSHPNESIIVDISHVYADDHAGPGQPGSKLALAAWLAKNLGPVAYPEDSTKTLSEVTLAQMRAAKRNIIVVGHSDIPYTSAVWSRDASLYTPWDGDSKAGSLFWDGQYAEAQFATVNQEAGSLKNPQAAGKLTVLNYIWNSACPISGFVDNVVCGAKYAAPGSLISWTREYLEPGLPGFLSALQYKTRQAGVSDRPFVVMRDAVTYGNNQVIWETNR